MACLRASTNQRWCLGTRLYAATIFVACLVFCVVRVDSAREIFIRDIYNVTGNLTCPLNEYETPGPPNPFYPRPACYYYSESTCCTPYQDESLYNYFRDELEPVYGVSPDCLFQLEVMLCALQCDPMQSLWISSAPVSGNSTLGNSTTGNFTNDNNTSSETVFHICQTYCDNLYEQCRTVPLGGGATVETTFGSAVAFCQATPSIFESIVRFNVSTNPTDTNSCFNGRQTSVCNSLIYGPGLDGEAFAGELTSFTIVSRDQYNNNITSGGDPWAVTLYNGQTTIPAIVTDRGNGSYLVAYNVTQAGQWTLNITLGNQSFCGIAPVVTVRAGSMYGPTSYALFRSRRDLIAGQLYTFELHAVDRYGNPLLIGGDTFLLSQLAGPAMAGSVLDLGDGTYLAMVEATVATTGYLLAVTDAAGLPIRDSPFDFRVFPAELDPASSYAYGEGLYRAVAGELASFIIQATDRYGNLLPYGGATWAIVFNGPGPVAYYVTDLDDGRYVVQYNATVAGNYSLSVMRTGIHIKGSPFFPVVGPGALDPFRSYAYGDGLYFAIAGENATFTIVTVDHWGNNLTTGGAVFNVSFVGPGAVDVYIVDNNDGTYTVRWTAIRRGTYSMSVLAMSAGGQHIRDSPFSPLVYSAATSAPHTVAAGPGLHNGTAFGRNEFCIEARDQFNNTREFGGERWLFTLELTDAVGANYSLPSPELFSSAINDLNNGTYCVVYYASVDGVVLLHVRYKGQDIADSPFTVVFVGVECRPEPRCNNHGLCISGQCKCFPGFRSSEGGNDCSMLDVGPTLLDVRFSDTGTALIATFSQATNRGELYGAFSCSGLLTADTVKLLGTGAYCYWKDDYRLVVVLGQLDDSVLPGDRFAVLPGTIASKQRPVLYANTSALVAPPRRGPPTPVPAIAAPSLLSACADLLLDGSLSSGSGGRAYVGGYRWAVEVVDGGAAANSTLSSLRTQLQQASGPRVTLSESLLARGATYRFYLTLTNFFNVTASSYVDVSKQDVDNSAIPTVTIEGPRVLQVQSYYAVYLRGAAKLCSGAGSHRISYQWRQRSGPLVELDAVSSRTAVLYLAAGQLTAGYAYQFELLAAVDDNEQLVGRQTVELRVQDDRHQPHVQPALRTVARLATLAVNASLPRGEHRSFHWSCYREDDPLLLSCLDPAAEAAYLADSPELLIPPATLHPGTYVFNATVTRDDRNDFESAAALVEVVLPSVPLVSIAPFASPLRPDQPFTLAGNASAPPLSPGKDIAYNWTVDGQQYTKKAELAELVLTATNVSSTRVRGGLLLPGVSHLFTLIGSDRAGSGSVTVAATVQEPPLSGVCSVQPPSGQTDLPFSVQCSYWEDVSSETPLRYRLAYVSPSCGYEVPLAAGPVLAPFRSVTLPPGTSTLVGFIENARGSYSRVELGGLTVVGPSTPRVFQAQQWLDGKLATAMAEEDMASLAQWWLAVVEALNDPAEASSLDQRQAIRSELLDIEAKSYITEKSPYSWRQRIHMLHLLSLRPEELTSEVQLGIVSELQRVLETPSAIQDELDDTMGEAILRTLSNLISAASQQQARKRFGILMHAYDRVLEVADKNDTRAIQAAVAFALLRAIDNLGEQLLRSAVPGQQPTILDEEAIYAAFRLDSVANIPLEYTATSVAVTLPNSLRKRLRQLTPTKGLVSSRFVVLYANPFRFAPSSESIVSIGIPGLQFTSAQGSPITLELSNMEPPPVELHFTLNQSLSQAAGHVPVCMRWDQDEFSWTTEGCGVGDFVDNSAEITCRCTQLASYFAVSFYVNITTVPSGNGTEKGAALQLETESSSQFEVDALLVVGGGVGTILAFILVVAVYHFSVQREKRAFEKALLAKNEREMLSSTEEDLSSYEPPKKNIMFDMAPEEESSADEDDLSPQARAGGS